MDVARKEAMLTRKNLVPVAIAPAEWEEIEAMVRALGGRARHVAVRTAEGIVEVRITPSFSDINNLLLDGDTLIAHGDLTDSGLHLMPPRYLLQIGSNALPSYE